MKRKLSLIAAVYIGVVFATAPLLAQEVDGRAVYEAESCNLCHGVPTVGIAATARSERLKGPDLVNLSDHYEAEWLAKYVKKETDKEGRSHTRPFKGSDEELQALVDWLLEQKAEGSNPRVDDHASTARPQ